MSFWPFCGSLAIYFRLEDDLEIGIYCFLNNDTVSLKFVEEFTFIHLFKNEPGARKKGIYFK